MNTDIQLKHNKINLLNITESISLRHSVTWKI